MTTKIEWTHRPGTKGETKEPLASVYVSIGGEKPEAVAQYEARRDPLALVPWARVGETDLPTLCREERAAVEDLWAEGEATGLGARELIAALESGRGA